MNKKVIKTFLESVFAIALLACVGYIFSPNDPWFVSLPLHPLWIIIFLSASRYTPRIASCIAVLCTILHLYAMSYSGIDLFLMWNSNPIIIIAPSLYIIVSIYISSSIERQRQRASFFNGKSIDLRERLDTTESINTELLDAYHRLEGKFAGQTDSVSALYDTSKQLDSLYEYEIYEGLLGALRTHLQVKDADVWIVQADETLAHWQRKEDTSPCALALKAFEENQTVHIASGVGDKNQEDDGILAGPLHSESSVVAIVVVYDMPFAGFTHTTIRLFALLLDWTSRSVEKALKFSGATENAMQYEDIGLSTEGYMRLNGIEGIARAKRQKTPASLLLFKIEGDISQKNYRKILLIVARVLYHLTRATDILAFYKKNESFAVFLGETNKEGAKIIWGKIKKCIKNFEITPYKDDSYLHFKKSITEYSTEIEDFDCMLKKGFQDLAEGDE